MGRSSSNSAGWCVVVKMIFAISSKLFLITTKKLKFNFDPKSDNVNH